MRTKLASVATAAALAVTGVTYIVTSPDSALAQETTTDTAVAAPEGRMKPPGTRSAHAECSRRPC